MTARDEAIEAAAKALLDTEWEWRAVGPVKHASREHYSADCPLCRPDYGDNSQKIAAAVLAASLPVLLNDLAARIEAHGDGGHTRSWNDATENAAEVVRAAAEGWGA